MDRGGMRIRSIAVSPERFPLTRPYAIAGQEPVTEVENVVVRIVRTPNATYLDARGAVYLRLTTHTRAPVNDAPGG